MAAARDHRFEAAWFEHLSKQAADMGVAADPVIRSTVERLTMGADRYGDEAFLTADVLQEAHEEAADLIAYSLLETHRRNLDGREGHHRLQRAALYAVPADHELRMSRNE